MKKLDKWARGYAVAVVAEERESAQKLWILSEEHRNGRHHNEDGTPSRVADCPLCAKAKGGWFYAPVKGGGVK